MVSIKVSTFFRKILAPKYIIFHSIYKVHSTKTTFNFLIKEDSQDSPSFPSRIHLSLIQNLGKIPQGNPVQSL